MFNKSNCSDTYGINLTDLNLPTFNYSTGCNAA